MTLKIMVKDLTQGRPGSVLFRFTLPVLGGNLFQLFYTLADTVIVGRALGENALAAVGSTSIIIYLVLCFIQGFTGGFGICLGQRFGAKDEDGMRRSAGISWLLSLFFTIVLTLAGCLLAHPILYWMQTPQDIYADALHRRDNKSARKGKASHPRCVEQLGLRQRRELKKARRPCADIHARL